MNSKPHFSVFCIAIVPRGYLLALLAGAVALSGCAGSFFGSSAPKQSQDLEEIGTRRANAAEEKRLDGCLHYIFKRQQAHFARERSYVRNLRALAPEEACGKILLSLETKPEGYHVTARIRDGETTVMWSVDESGAVVEHDDLSFDFSL